MTPARAAWRRWLAAAGDAVLRPQRATQNARDAAESSNSRTVTRERVEGDVERLNDLARRGS